MMESVVTAFHGKETLESANIKNLKTGEIKKFTTNGAFIFIGYIPNTEFLKGKIDLSQSGEIIVQEDMSTSLKGVFAAGDSIVKRYRQITTAVSDGTIAALSAAEFLNKIRKEEKQLISN
jgi:thioredoxin reductase (NADPH)